MSCQLKSRHATSLHSIQRHSTACHTHLIFTTSTQVKSLHGTSFYVTKYHAHRHVASHRVLSGQKSLQTATFHFMLYIYTSLDITACHTMPHRFTFTPSHSTSPYSMSSDTTSPRVTSRHLTPLHSVRFRTTSLDVTACHILPGESISH